tara:strand:+ start:651 stop:1076 length:426 start_codon:yes stop_codon:yes gene_type:complete
MSVYKVCDGEKVYYGSTTQDLRRRLTTHKTDTKNECETRHFNKDNMTIELLEEVEDAEQLLWRERYYIENNECVNKRLPIMTEEERIKLRKTRCNEYYKINKETINQRKQQPYQCECGSVITWRSKSQHFKSKKHINNINE